MADLTILQGDCRDVLKTLPDASVHCVVTSPPYWGLRDYGADDQIGQEPTPLHYVATLVQVFAEIRRVLRPDGTAWLNLGDCYANDRKWGGYTSGKHAKGLHGTNAIGRLRTQTGLPSKSLVGLPWRVAFALQDDGWTLRNDIIWEKPDAMPESVKDRVTRSHEYIFLFTQGERYHFDHEAIKEPAVYHETRIGRVGQYQDVAMGKDRASREERQAERDVSMRNRRSVWRVPTANYGGAHFATFPEALIEPCILAGCPRGGVVLDPFGGSGTTGRVALKYDRSAILIELNPGYVDQIEQRTSAVQTALV